MDKDIIRNSMYLVFYINITKIHISVKIHLKGFFPWADFEDFGCYSA